MTKSMKRQRADAAAIAAIERILQQAGIDTALPTSDCPKCHTTMQTTVPHVGRELTVYRFTCPACGHTEVEPFD